MENLNQSSNSKIQNEFETSKNDSGFQDISIDNPLLLTNEQEQQSLNVLNNRLSNYIEYVRNQDLITKSSKSLEEISEIPSIQLENIKSLYESEIKNLREALDVQSNDMAALTIKNNKLCAEKDNFQVEINNQSQKVLKLIESVNKLESENTTLKVQLSDLQDNQNLAHNLADKLNKCQEQLENEVLLRTSSDNACLTYKEKMEFNDAIFKKELGALMITHKLTLKKMNAFQNIISSKFHEQMDEARNKLKDDLHDFRDLINDNFLETINKAAESISSRTVQLSKLRNANDVALKEQHKLMVELEKVKVSHIKLENQLSNIQTLNEEEINRLNDLVNELTNEKIDELDKNFNDFQNLSDSIGEKVLLGEELTIYRKMLDSEETRTDFFSGPTESKRRKTSFSSGEILSNRNVLKAVRRKKTCAIM